LSNDKEMFIVKPIKTIATVIALACYFALVASAVTPQSIQHLREIDSIETGKMALQDADLDQIIKEVKNRQETRKAKLEKDFGIVM
jgi:hypothetical protein